MHSTCVDAVSKNWTARKSSAASGVIARMSQTVAAMVFICGDEFCQCVQLSPEAAAYGAQILSEEHGLDQYAIYRDFDAFGVRISNSYLIARPLVLLLSKNAEHFKALIGGEYLVVSADRVHRSPNGQRTAVIVARDQSKTGEEFDFALFDIALGYPLFQACTARLKGAINRIILVDSSWSYARLVRAIRGSVGVTAEWPKPVELPHTARG